MSLLTKILGKKIEQKSNPVGSLLYMTGQYRGSFGDPQTYITMGYNKNPTIRECVDIIAVGAAGVKFCLKQRNADGTTEEIDQHPILDLLDRPNPTQTKREFFREFFTSRLVTGNGFLIADQLTPQSPPVELWNIPARAVQIMASDTGIPSSYKFVGMRGNKEFEVNPITGMSQIYHSKEMNLIDNLFGISPLTAARVWVDVGNEGAEWNAALLENGCQASGVLKKTGTPLTDTQYSQIKQRFEKENQGSRNAGVPMILDNGLDWTQTGINPKDMDFQNSLNYSDKKICGIYRVPYVLLSPDASTFNNVENARRILWEDTIASFLDNFLDSFDNWILPKYTGKDAATNIFLEANYDDVPAFQIKKQQQSDRVQALLTGGVLTRNEARQQLGYEEIDVPEADEIYIPSTMVPLDSVNDAVNSAIDNTSKLFLDDNQPDPQEDDNADTAAKGKAKTKANRGRSKKT